MEKNFEVEVALINSKGNIRVVRKAFATDKARAKWIDKVEEKGELYEVRGYRDPEN